jgi:hypothetical protein
LVQSWALVRDGNQWGAPILQSLNIRADCFDPVASRDSGIVE